MEEESIVLQSEIGQLEDKRELKRSVDGVKGMIALLTYLLSEFLISNFPNKNVLVSEDSFCETSYLIKVNAFCSKTSTCKSLDMHNGERSEKYTQYV